MKNRALSFGVGIGLAVSVGLVGSNWPSSESLPKERLI